MKGDEGTMMVVIALLGLVAAVLVLVYFAHLVFQGVYGACWEGAKTGFTDLKDGNNQINLGGCIGKVYIIKREQLDSFRSDKNINIFSCSHMDQPEYLSFVIIKPNTDLGLTDFLRNPIETIQGKLPENYCVEYKYRFNTVNKNILDGKNYCINMQRVANDPNVKNLQIREGRC